MKKKSQELKSHDPKAIKSSLSQEVPQRPLEQEEILVDNKAPAQIEEEKKVEVKSIVIEEEKKE